MSDRRQKNQLVLAFPAESRREAPTAAREGTESLAAKRRTKSPAITEQWMEEVCERALARIKANKGSPGVEGMTVHKRAGHLKQHWLAIREQLLSGTYKPQPVKRVEIPKPDGGVRKLGIPTVLDRFIQQAVMQVLQRRWDRTFSEHSYGFRPKRSARQAVRAAQQNIAEGYRWVVDLDLEKFFDRVNHDKLMAEIAERVSDKRMRRLIRAFLRAGGMEDGLVSTTEEGTPQSGPFTPRTQKIASVLTEC
jgi:RNA-directed DNA polymerase